MENKKAILTITEDEKGQINIHVDFCKDGLNEESFVHKIALFAVEKISEISEELKDND